MAEKRIPYRCRKKSIYKHHLFPAGYRAQHAETKEKACLTFQVGEHAEFNTLCIYSCCIFDGSINSAIRTHLYTFSFKKPARKRASRK